tara:strand:+ start:302 stop:757 length:456 start_codon:yes stop_codon:yes gene_type:complete
MIIMVEGKPPSVNHIYGFTWRHGQAVTYLLPEAKEYKKHVWAMAQNAVVNQKWIVPEIGRRVGVSFWFFWADRKKRDTHNCLKLILDGLQGVVYPDDQYVLPSVIDFQVDPENPRVEMVVRLPPLDQALSPMDLEAVANVERKQAIERGAY